MVGLDELALPNENKKLTAVVQESQCPLCKYIFREPFSGSCKHPCCKSCLAVFLTRDIPSGDSVACPTCRRPLNLKKLKPDQEAERKLQKIRSCRCKNCNWKGTYTDYIQNHERKCGGGARIQCKVLGCGKWLPEKRALDIHRTDEWCPMILIMKARLNQAEIVHLSMRESWDWTCGLVLRSDKSSVRDLIERLVLVFSALDPKVPITLENDEYAANQTSEAESLSQLSNLDINQVENKKTDREQELLQGILATMNKDVMAIRERLDQLGPSPYDREFQEKMKKKYHELLQSIESLYQFSQRVDERLIDLETSHEGVLLWKIDHYSERKTSVMNTNIKSIYSVPFFTGQYGYKLCGRVFLMGNGVGKGTHISFFLTIMKGPYDATRPWPFKERITFQLVNQDDPINKSIIESFIPDPSSSSFKRPTSEKNIAAGCPLFAEIKMIDNPKSGFVRDNTIYLKIICKTNEIPQIK